MSWLFCVWAERDVASGHAPLYHHSQGVLPPCRSRRQSPPGADEFDLPTSFFSMNSGGSASLLPDISWRKSCAFSLKVTP